jgi:hypothetical protein
MTNQAATSRAQLLLYFNGAVFILIAMGVGLPGFWLATKFQWTDMFRQEIRQSHTILVATGLWLIATGAALPLFDSNKRMIATLVWSLIISGYTFLPAIAVHTIIFLVVNPHPAGSVTQSTILDNAPWHLGYVYKAWIGISAFTSVVAGVVMVIAAFKALRRITIELALTAPMR